MNYAEAIYGSLIAASTVLGTTAASVGFESTQLVVALLVTSAIFWLLHVYVRVVGRELPLHTPWRLGTRRAARREAPILLAVLPPVGAVLLSMVIDQPAAWAAWAALWAALAGQVFWTWLAVRQAGTRRSVALMSLAVSTLLGLVLVGLKFFITH